jgi:hypothetical protein
MSGSMAADDHRHSGCRGRSGTIIAQAESQEEDSNIPSQRRRSLLLELGQALATNEVPAAFWACLQVCDIEKLEYIIQNARDAPFFVSCFADTCVSIPHTWMQRPQVTRHSSTSRSTTSEASSKRLCVRESVPKKLAQERDGGHCVITGDKPIDTAHIYPNCLIHPSQASTPTPNFWKMLSAFWPAEKIRRWQAEIFRDPLDPLRSTDACFNLMCLSPTIHRMWGAGIFALRPLQYSADMTELEVEWQWQPIHDHRPQDLVSLTKLPLSSQGLDSVVAPDGNT